MRQSAAKLSRNGLNVQRLSGYAEYTQASGNGRDLTT
ncbi:hypothetical protein KEN51_CDS0346 [Pseudomonas phage vB_Pae10145-KEN51]|uniref:PHIKZ072.1 n=1 Tax=Pseudomonas phage phiKZ TaxID=2905945 RepID=L7T0K1_BPDPK|nr:PHIKZ072.1 [Pseudomonas phage phiKZ]WNV49671.1 hypothetical protein [Pseudomonas phage ANB1]WNV50070.1 hypothetical protein [Pseudomonas phage PhiPizzaParty]WRQ05788.1 hypothetical protein IPCDMZAV_CDS0265 [Pseudomonas phage 6B]WRQ06285.1 hypothetical protein QAMIJHJT_CDS0354 [Pseudomonas phage 9-Ps-8B]WRQ06693.1 hypothetical protein FOPPYZMZ_CDS0353 [Pseudomonas phage 9Ps-7B]WRQ07044.1 hypothetical protein ZBUARNPM_CDS0295 [Pseudomonas phage 14Ps5-6]